MRTKGVITVWLLCYLLVPTVLGDEADSSEYVFMLEEVSTFGVANRPAVHSLIVGQRAEQV